MRFRFLVIFGFLAAGLVLSEFGCSTMVPSIARSPERYFGCELTISGKVSRLIPIPMSRFSAYLLEDRDMKIPVFSSRYRIEGGNVIARGRIVSCDGGISRGDNDETLRLIEEFLVENARIDSDLAPGMVKGVIGAITRISGNSGSIYFLLEK